MLLRVDNIMNCNVVVDAERRHVVERLRVIAWQIAIGMMYYSKSIQQRFCSFTILLNSLCRVHGDFTQNGGMTQRGDDLTAIGVESVTDITQAGQANTNVRNGVVDDLEVGSNILNNLMDLQSD